MINSRNSHKRTGGGGGSSWMQQPFVLFNFRLSFVYQRLLREIQTIKPDLFFFPSRNSSSVTSFFTHASGGRWVRSLFCFVLFFSFYRRLLTVWGGKECGRQQNMNWRQATTEFPLPNFPSSGEAQMKERCPPAFVNAPQIL